MYVNAHPAILASARSRPAARVARPGGSSASG
jgi:hypothetical protein